MARGDASKTGSMDVRVEADGHTKTNGKRK